MKIFFSVLFILFLSSSSALAATTIPANASVTAASKSRGIPLNWKVYKTSDSGWSIRYPRGWQIMPKHAFDAVGVTAVGVLQGHDRIKMYAPTIVITEEKFKKILSSSEFSRNAIQSVSTLRDYTLIKQERIITQSGEHELHVFTARLDDSNTPSRRYYQIYAVIGDTGFVFTARTKITASRSLDATIRKMLSSIYFSDFSTTNTSSSSSSFKSATTQWDGVLLRGKHQVILKTSKGDIHLELDADVAPKTVTNFVSLSKKGYYNGLTFHRVIPGFMIQGGDPTGNGRGGKSIFGETFEDEINPSSATYQTGYKAGVIAMANRGPNTNGSQFFIMDTHYPLQPNSTIFGRVTAGQDVVGIIARVPRDERDMPKDKVTFDVVLK